MDPFDLRIWPLFTQAGGNPILPAIIDQVTIDSRLINSHKALFIALPGETFDGHSFVLQAANKGASYAVVKSGYRLPSPSPITLLHVDDPLIAFQQLAGLYRQTRGIPVIGITGSFGKTMLKDLLQEILSRSKKTLASPESFNSQIGVALSLFNLSSAADIALIEAGISKPEEMHALAQMIQPTHSILTTIGKAHLSTLHNLNTITHEKMQLLQITPPEGWCLLPKDPLSEPYLAKLKAKVYFWNEYNPKLPQASFSSKLPSKTMPYQVTFPDNIHFQGTISHGFIYVLDLINIAIKAAWLLGVPSKTICETLKTYSPEPLRIEIWRSPTGLTFINEPYCSDPLSVSRALKSLSRFASLSRKVLIFGGLRNQLSHAPSNYRYIGEAIADSKVALVILHGTGDYTPLIEELHRRTPKTEVHLCHDDAQLIKQMETHIHKEDVILIKGQHKELISHISTAFAESISDNRFIINLRSIQNNIEAFRTKLPPHTRIMVMVKAGGYGTDNVLLAKFLTTYGIDILGVAYVDEGIALRRAGVSQEIFVLNAAVYEAEKLVKWNLEIAVSNKLLIDEIEKEAVRQKRKVKLHLHIDTGMSRFGCRTEEALGLAKLIHQSQSLVLEGVMSHFASPDTPGDDLFTQGQAELLRGVLRELEQNNITPNWRHAAGSSGVIRFSFPEFNMARIGLGIFGLHSSEDSHRHVDTQLALTLTSRIVGINICKKGETISYSRTYTVQREEEHMAIIPLGYFDGLHRRYSGHGHVIIRGRPAPLIGTICMDYMMVDITDIPEAEIGDTVLIFGKDAYGYQLAPEQFAKWGEGSVYELITCLGPRIQRIFVQEEVLSSDF